MKIGDRIKRFINNRNVYHTVLTCKKCREERGVLMDDVTPQEIKKLRNKYKKFICKDCRSGQG